MSRILRVGVFDSGIGGLTVLARLERRLPDVSFLYCGDNRRAPYGSRPPEEVERFVRAALVRFKRAGVCAAVLACNTATAVCAERMRAEFPFPVLGMEPAVLPAARAGSRILVLCTPLTARSDRLAALVRRAEQSCGCTVTVYGAEGLAGAIEEALTHGAPLDLSAHLPAGEFDGVALGCTHYVFFAREISAFYGAPVYDGNDGVARRLEEILRPLRAPLGEGRGGEIAGKANHFCKELNKWGFGGRFRNISTKSNIKFVFKNKKCNKRTYEHTFGRAKRKTLPKKRKK